MVAPNSETTKLGKRGVVVIPASIRRRFGLTEGTLLIAEGTPEGILLKPAVAMPVEIYTPERKAEFLLSNAVDADDYAWAVREVRESGLDPAKIPHVVPASSAGKRTATGRPPTRPPRAGKDKKSR